MRTIAFYLRSAAWIMVLGLVTYQPAFAISKIAVLDFELNDLTLNPGTPEEIERTASLKSSLTRALTARKDYEVIEIGTEAQREANRGFGYLFDHVDVAAALAREAGADWVVVGRVHKASFLFVYFMARVVDAATARLAADLVAEVKGPQRELTVKGIERLASEIDETIRRGGRENGRLEQGPHIFATNSRG